MVELGKKPMRRIESIDDKMNGVVTYELGDGKRVRFDARAVAEYGIAHLLRQCGYSHAIPTERLPVMQNGRRIGTMAPDFEPLAIKSRSFLYNPRPGDFRRDGGTWIASRTLGFGDMESVPGFQRDAKQ